MTNPLKKSDMHITGVLFGMRFVPGGSNGLVELYVEDDENYFLKVVFDRFWLGDLINVSANADKALNV